MLPEVERRQAKLTAGPMTLEHLLGVVEHLLGVVAHLVDDKHATLTLPEVKFNTAFLCIMM